MKLSNSWTTGRIDKSVLHIPIYSVVCQQEEIRHLIFQSPFQAIRGTKTKIPTFIFHVCTANCVYFIIASADYTSIATNLRFGLNRRKQCVLIPVIDDMVPEVQESFRVILTTTTPSPGIVLTPDSATIIINSDDGKYQ